MSTIAPPLPPGVTHQHVSLGAERVSVLSGGEGPPLLFLHGAGGSGLWLPVHALLAEHFAVTAPDHPGFGGSDEFPAVEDVHDLAFHYADLLAELGLEQASVVGTSFGGWIAAELAELGLEQASVVGTSFGGWIAAELAAYRPALVDRLVLVDPIGLYVDGAPIADMFMMSPAQKMASLFHDPSVAAGLFPAEPDLDVILAMARDEAAFARFAWEPFCHDPRLPRLLPRITAPTLVAWAEHDALVPRAHAERYAELIPQARLDVLPGCGHAAALERPDELAARIVSFHGR